jgi:glycosyltransferase involved in cell wall biosynthesis
MATDLVVVDSHDFRGFAETFGGHYPYGLETLNGLGFTVRHVDWPYRPTFPPKGLNSVDVLLRRLGTGGVGVWAHLGAASRADLCLSIFERNAMAYNTLRRVVSRKSRKLPPQVVMSCWMAQWCLSWQYFRPLRDTVDGSVGVTVFSSNQVDLLASALDQPLDKFTVVPFGVDTEYYTPGSDRDDYVAVAGNDVGRDWPTFVRAAAELPDLHFRVASGREHFRRLGVPENVVLLGSLSHDDYRSLLRRSLFVVLPCHPLAYPSGQSVLLESHACGKIVVGPLTAALREYARDGIYLPYDPGDPRSLVVAARRARSSITDDSALAVSARRHVVENFTYGHMWEAVAPVLTSAVARYAS